MTSSIATTFVNGYTKFTDSDGSPLSNGTAAFFLAGTSTPVVTYQDEGKNAANEIVIDLDASGGASIWLDPTNGGNECVSFKLLLKDANGVAVDNYPVDGLPVFAPSAGAFLSTSVIGYGASTTLTINGGAIAPSLNRHMLSPQGGSPDDLTDIAVTNLPDGALLILGNTNGSATITVKDATGNIILENGDCELATTSARIVLIRQGANWVEVSRSTSSAAGMSPTVLFTNDTPASSVGSTPTTLWSQTIAGGTLANDGESIAVVAVVQGVSSADMKTVDLLVDGDVVRTITADTTFSDLRIDLLIMRFTQTTQGISASMGGDMYSAGTIDLTTDFDIAIRATGVVDNDVTYRMSIVSKNPVGSLT